jgi:hypothetical protein
MLTVRETVSLVKSASPLPVIVTGDGVTPLSDALKLMSAVVTGLAALCLTTLGELDAAAALTIAPAVPIPSTPTIPAQAIHLVFGGMLFRSPYR